VNIYKIHRCVRSYLIRYHKVIALLIFLTQICSTTTSQTFIASLHGGINQSQLSGDDLSGFRKTGLHGGVSVSYPWSNLQKQIAIELLYQQKGSRGTDVSGTNQEIAVNTLSIPVIYRWGEWYNDQTERHNFYIDLGTVVNSIIGVSSENTFFDNRTSDFNDFDWGLIGGVSISIGQKFSSTIRYERSITSIFNDPMLSIRGLQSFLFTIRLDYRL